MNDIIFYLVAGHRHRLAVRLARHRPRGRVQGLRRHQLRPGGDGDVRRGHVRPGVEPGRDLPPVGRPPADRLAQPAGADHAQRQRRGADGRGPRHRPGDGRAARPRRPLPRLPPAAPRRTARQGRRLARPGAVPAGRGPAQLRHELPDAEVGLPEPQLGVRELPRPRQPVPPQQPVRLLRRRHRRRRRVGRLQVHPLRHGDPRRGEQREGRRPARLLAAAAGRDELGRRLDARHASPPSSSVRSRGRSRRSA